MEHIYYEVGTSLLAKPQALCDLVEFEAGHSCVVFCNSPSDADFADVILKKRGLSSLKLIGYVPQIKLSKAIQQLQKKEITALVLTDVAARGVPLEEFEVVINYSIPADPEVYFQRFAAEGETKTKKVLSLVSAMDITNFHFLKKLGKAEFVQAEPPTADQVMAGKFDQLRDQAVARVEAGEPALTELVDKVLADSKSREIVSYLLNNTLSVIPALRAATAPARDERSEFDEEEFEDDSSQPDFDKLERGGRRGGGRDRDRRESRGGRDRDRGDRGGRGERGNRGGRGGRYQDDFVDEDRQPSFLAEGEGNGGERRGRGRDRDRGGRGERGERGQYEGRDGGRRQRQPRKPMVVDKEARLYVGSGSKQGVSADALKEQVASACGVAAEEVHRVSVRGAYSFIDVSEKVADEVVEKLAQADLPGSKGGKYFVKRAVTLSIPRDPTPEELAAMQSESESDSYGGSDEGSESYDEDRGSSRGRRSRRDESHDDEGGSEEEGPTLLAVDDQA
jgi:ATP-dependent RNA helicase DeaD